MPFMFCLNPALLGKGTNGEIILAIISALIGAYGLATAVQRYFKGNLSWPKTIVVLLGSVATMMPGIKSDIFGLVCLGTIYALQIIKSKKSYSKGEVNVI